MGVGLSFQATSDRTRGSAFTRARRGLNLISEKISLPARVLSNTATESSEKLCQNPRRYLKRALRIMV